VKRWRGVPGVMDGKKVDVISTVRIDFSVAQKVVCAASDFVKGPGPRFADSFSKGVPAMLRKSLFVSVLFVLVLAVAAVPSFAISKEFDQTYPLQPAVRSNFKM